MLRLLFFFSALFFLAGMFFLTSLTSAFRRLHKKDSQKQLQSLGTLFPYRLFHLFFFPKLEYEGLFFAALCAQNVSRFGFAASATLFLVNTPLPDQWEVVWMVLSVIGFLLLSFIIGDYLPRLFGTRLSEQAIRVSAPFASFFLFLVFPITYILLKITQAITRNATFDYAQEAQAQAKQEIIDIVQETDLSQDLSPHDKKLFESVLTFKDLIAREVMVPRVDMFALPAETSIKDTAKLLDEEGYSRVPVFKNTVDNIIGVLMYKDLLKKFQEAEAQNCDPKILAAPIESLVKPILYTPETKKLSQLLQEFRKKQVHLAIVVDEYGGTEGIVTIEDILEEIVGDIADEYDEEADQFTSLPDGSWVVDPRMSILDAEEQFGIEFPQEGDYDTIGGYIFHCAGAIPARGFVIHNDDFEIEILRSSERSVEKVKIRPTSSSQENS